MAAYLNTEDSSQTSDNDSERSVRFDENNSDNWKNSKICNSDEYYPRSTRSRTRQEDLSDLKSDPNAQKLPIDTKPTKSGTNIPISDNKSKTSLKGDSSNRSSKSSSVEEGKEPEHKPSKTEKADDDSTKKKELGSFLEQLNENMKSFGNDIAEFSRKLVTMSNSDSPEKSVRCKPKGFTYQFESGPTRIQYMLEASIDKPRNVPRKSSLSGNDDFAYPDTEPFSFNFTMQGIFLEDPSKSKDKKPEEGGEEEKEKDKDEPEADSDSNDKPKFALSCCLEGGYGLITRSSECDCD